MEQKSLDPAPIFAAIGVKAPDAAFTKEWAQTQASFPHVVPFLQPQSVHAACRELRMQPDAELALVDSLALIAEHPALKQVAWHCHQQLIAAVGREAAAAKIWPELPEQLGLRAKLFYPIVFLSALSAIRAFHKQRGIPDEISISTLGDLELWIRENKRLKGHFGFAQSGWLSVHFSGGIYKLGRLQFEPHPFRYDLNAYRNSATKAVVLLAGSGLKFRRDGQFDGANGIRDPQAFTSDLTETRDAIIGTPINVRGYAETKPVTLNAKEWKKVFGKGSPILDIHIDNSGPMDHAECGKSFERAGPFFAKYFPERKFDAFTCTSWLMDSQFEDYLPASSNIVRFLSEYHLFPMAEANDGQTYERVFDGPVADLDKAPQKSSLQRAVIAHEKSGKKWRNAGGFILREDLAWGNRVYRKPG
jgi:hypothetical protein